MNQCDDRIKELLPLYPDNELTTEEKYIVDKHVAICSDCIEELKLYKEIHDAFDLDSIEAPKGFHNDLVSKLELLPKKSKPSLYKRYNKYINVAAMLVFVIFLSVLGLMQGNKWGQTSDEAIMNKAEMAIVTTTEETMEMVMEESKEATKSEPKMDIAVEAVQEEINEEETMEIFMAESEEVAEEESEEVAKEVSVDATTGSKEDSGVPTLAFEETEEKTDGVSDGNTNEDTFTLADESVENDMNNRSIVETDDASDTEVAFAESGTTNESKEPVADVESSQIIQTGNPKEEPKTSVFVYILIIIISLVVGGSVFHFIRKRILRN